MVEGKFMAVCISSAGMSSTRNYPRTLFVFENGELRPTAFELEDKFNLQITDYFSMGNFSVVKTFDFEEKVSVESPIYYIDNLNEKIVAQSKWKCGYLNKQTLPGFDVNLLVDAEYDNGDVTQIICN